MDNDINRIKEGGSVDINWKKGGSEGMNRKKGGNADMDKNNRI